LLEHKKEFKFLKPKPFRYYTHHPDDPNSLSTKSVLSIYEEDSGIIWIGTSGGGLNRYDPEKNEFNHYKHDSNDSTSLSNNYVNSIYEDRSGSLWIGTPGGGLNKFNKNNGTFNHYNFDIGDSASISSNKIESISGNSKGILWIASFSHGINKLVSGENKFQHLRLPGEKNILLIFLTIKMISFGLELLPTDFSGLILKIVNIFILLMIPGIITV